VADGPPDQLKASIGARVEVAVGSAAELPDAQRVLAALTGGEPAADPHRLLVEVVSRPGAEISLPTVVRELDAAGVTARDVALRTPTLDDVFLALTGTGAAPQAETGTAATPTTNGDHAEVAA
jgi:ABC-2 type transport system ATP-binding protein